MKITLCWSITFLDEINKIKADLERIWHEIKAPEKAFKLEDGRVVTEKEYLKLMNNEEAFKKFKNKVMKDFFDKKIKWCDAMLVVNPEKKEIDWYIWANTFLEMWGAFYLWKKIYALNKIEQKNFKDEIDGMWVDIINNNLNLIWKQ